MNNFNNFSAQKSGLFGQENQQSLVIEDLSHHFETFTKEIKLLKDEIDIKNKTITDLEKKIMNLNTTIDNLRYDYMKDLCHLRELMFQKEVKNSAIDYIDVRFFEATHDID